MSGQKEHSAKNLKLLLRSLFFSWSFMDLGSTAQDNF